LSIFSLCSLRNTELNETELTGKETAKCPNGVDDLTDLSRVTDIECSTGVDDLLTAAFAKGYIRETPDQLSSVAY